MVEGKIDVLMRTSDANVSRAEKRLRDGEFDSAVFHASLAVENAANALILRLGGQEARDHRAISGLNAVLRRVKPELLQNLECQQLIERGLAVQGEVVYARYPANVGGKWVTPMEYCDEKKASDTVENAKFVNAAVKKLLQR